MKKVLSSLVMICMFLAACDKETKEKAPITNEDLRVKAQKSWA